MSTSRDGARVVFNSNFGLQSEAGYPGEYSDVYLMQVGAAPPAEVAPTPPVAAQPVAPVSPTVARQEQANNSALQFSGAWYPNNGASNSGGSAVLAMDAGAQATFRFTGTGVQWIGLQDPWSGRAEVYLDGQRQGTIDTYSPGTQAQAVLYSLSGLPDAAHTLKIVVTGTRNASSGGSWVWVDAFDVTTATAAAPAAPSAPARIEQTAPAVAWSGGGWFTNTTAHGSGGSAGLAMAAGARATLTFTGTAVKWIGYRDQWSGIARVYVDGVLASTVDTYAAPSQAQTVLYTATGLAQGVHTLAVEVLGTRNAASGGAWVWVDAFDVTP